MNSITINTDLLGIDFIEQIKKMFPHKTVEIIVQPSDETENILSNEKFATELKNRISDLSKNKEAIKISIDDLL